MLAYLGRQQRTKSLDPGGLASMLGAERSHIQARTGASTDMLSQLIDRDGDGDPSNDLARMGMDLLGGFLGGGKK